MNEPTTTIPTPPVMTDTLEASPCISEITGALVALQLRHATAVLDKTNPRFKSRYTSLYSLQQAVLPILAEHGVAVIQNLSTEATERGTILVVQTLFSHPSGEWLRARSASGPLDRSDIQSIGSTCTYLRRFSLAALCNIPQAEDAEPDLRHYDDDGESVMPTTAKPKATPKAKTKTKAKTKAKTTLETTLEETVPEDAPFLVEHLTPNGKGGGSAVLTFDKTRITRTVHATEVMTTLTAAQEENIPVWVRQDSQAGIVQAQTTGPIPVLSVDDIPF